MRKVADSVYSLRVQTSHYLLHPSVRRLRIIFLTRWSLRDNANEIWWSFQ
jgi:hypothetical protein